MGVARGWSGVAAAQQKQKQGEERWRVLGQLLNNVGVPGKDRTHHVTSRQGQPSLDSPRLTLSHRGTGEQGEGVWQRNQRTDADMVISATESTSWLAFYADMIGA